MKLKLLAVLKEIQGDTVPNEFQLLPMGKIEIEGEGPAFLDEAAMESIIAEQKRRGNDMVIDYEHQTLEGVQAPAAGWIKDLINKGQDGLFAVVEWTEKAKKYLQTREYRYFSPVFWIDAACRIVKIEHVALTNYPKLNNLKPIMAKYGQKFEKEEDTMLKKLKELLGLADEAGEDRAIEAVTLLVNKNKELETRGTMIACKEVIEALGAKPEASAADLVQIVAGLKAPADAAVALSHQVASLSKEIAEIKQRDLIAQAINEGKTSPEELDKWGRDLALKSPEQFKKIVLSRLRGSVVPVDGISHSKEDKKGENLDDVQRSINKMMGVDDETFKKFSQV